MQPDLHKDPVGYSTLEIFQEARRFNSWMYSRFSRFIGKTVLEIGSGTGNITSLIQADRIYATDYSGEYVEILKEKFKGQDNVIPMHLDISSGTPSLSENADTIVCLNVLEHIKDHRRALKNMYNVLAPGGTLILLVPFSNLLFSKLDELLGHYRRYTKHSLNNVVSSAGFKVIKTFHFNLFGGIGWFVRGRLLRQVQLSVHSIRTFERLMPFFKTIEHFGTPFGASIICIAGKPAEGSFNSSKESTDER